MAASWSDLQTHNGSALLDVRFAVWHDKDTHPTQYHTQMMTGDMRFIDDDMWQQELVNDYFVQLGQFDAGGQILWCNIRVLKLICQQ